MHRLLFLISDIERDILVVDEKVIFKQDGGATTSYVQLNVSNRSVIIDFASVQTFRGNFMGMVEMEDGSVRAVYKMANRTLRSGEVAEQFLLQSPVAGIKSMYIKRSMDEKTTPIDKANWAKMWKAEVAKSPEYIDQTLHLLTGTLLPVWNKLPTENTRVVRVATNDGKQYLGRIINKDKIDGVLRNFNVGRTIKSYTSKDVYNAVLNNGEIAYLSNDRQVIKRSLVSGERRLEIEGNNVWFVAKDIDAIFKETINSKPRYFIPTGDSAISTLDEVMKYNKVVDVKLGSEDQFSLREEGQDKRSNDRENTNKKHDEKMFEALINNLVIDRGFNFEFFDDVDVVDDSDANFALSDEGIDFVKEYTYGKYNDCCNYTQFIVSGKVADYSDEDTKTLINGMSDDTRERSVELLNEIREQPKMDKLYRLERNPLNKAYNVGDMISWGVRSTSSNEQFAETVLLGVDDGVHLRKMRHGDDNNDYTIPYVEFRINNARALPIADLSAFEQAEHLTYGNFEVVDTFDYENNIKLESLNDVMKEGNTDWEKETRKDGSIYYRSKIDEDIVILDADKKVFYNNQHIRNDNQIDTMMEYAKKAKVVVLEAKGFPEMDADGYVKNLEYQIKQGNMKKALDFVKKAYDEGYRYFGIRTNDEKDVGAYTALSHDWDIENDRSSKGKLDGSSATNIYFDILNSDEENIANMEKASIANKVYHGDYRYIVAGMEGKHGSDEDEIVINNNSFTRKRGARVVSEVNFSLSQLGDMGTFESQVDSVLDNNADFKHSHLYMGDTPSIYEDFGLDTNKAILVTANHIKTMNAVSEKKNDHRHGLSREVIKALPKAIANPTMVMISNSRPNDSLVVVTNLLDSENRPIIVSILANGEGRYNSILIEANIMTSSYGRTGFNNFLDIAHKENRMLYVDKEKSQQLMQNPGVQFPNNLQTDDLSNNILQFKEKVNSNSKNIASYKLQYKMPNFLKNNVKQLYIIFLPC